MKFGNKQFTALLGGAALLLALGGCGGGSGSAASSSTLNGVAMAGPFLSGQVCAYQVTNGAKGALLGTCTPIIAATSSFSVDVGTYTGDVLVEVSNATYDDEANPNDNVTGTPLTGTLRNLIHVGSTGATVTLAVTPLTEAALRLTGATLDNTHMQAAVAQIAGLLPLGSGVDLRLTPPEAGTAAGLAYREALRALSQLQWGVAGAGQFAGHLDTFLSNLAGQMGGANTLAADLLGQINSGMNSNCALAAGVLSCSVASGGNSGGSGGGSSTPSVTSYTPSTGAVGSTVTLSGSNLGNFTPAPLVKFGSTAATVSSATATSISVTVPAGLAAGSVAITLSNFDGTGTVSVGNFTVTASAGDGSTGGGGTGGSGTGSGGNTTTGTATNGTPAFDPTKCASSIPLGSAGGLSMTMYLACGANAVADFTGVSMVDFTDGNTCTASYSAGVLTVVKGPLTASAALNGDKGSDSITTLTNGTTETISTLSPQDKTSATSNTIATVRWDAAGAVKQIQGGATAIGGAYQTFNCFQP